MTWEEDMTDLFEDLRDADEFRATLFYQAGTELSTYVTSTGDTYATSDGDTYAARTAGATIYGVKMALSLGFQMQTTGYSRKADTAFDALRSEVEDIGLYAKCANRNPSVIRPTVEINDEQFMVLDLKDDIATDPTVKLILSALQ